MNHYVRHDKFFGLLRFKIHTASKSEIVVRTEKYTKCLSFE